MARNLDVATLRSFVAVADAGGVTKAAQRLHLTQSAVSMQIKRLEESLGLELLTREGRGVALTRRGEELLSQARRMISLNDAIWERMTAPEAEGEVVFGLPHDIIYPLAPAILKAFYRDFPGVKVSLVSSLSTVLLERLDAGEVDVILTTEHGVGEQGETLIERPLVWTGAPDGRAWRRRPVPIAFERRCAFRKHTFAALEATGLEWEWIVDSEYFDAAMASIVADLAICTMLRGTLPRSLAEIDHGGELPTLPMMRINLYVANGGDRTLADRLAAYVRANFEATLSPPRPDPALKVA